MNTTIEPDAFSALCPSRPLLARIAEKWTLLALVALENGPMRFGQLKRRLDGVSQKMLTQSLRNLERDGLLDRTIFDEMPLRVEYRLTPLARELLPIVHDLKRWAETQLYAVEAANRAHDAAKAS